MDFNFKKSYSQSGEDMIVSYLFDSVINISNPTYLDIGANHYSKLSNSYYFYRRGNKGVCVEPDPLLYNEIIKHRKRDTCLNVGIGISDATEANFYVLNYPELNTFSKEAVDKISDFVKIERVIKVPLININKIIEDYFDSQPNFISIDVEGWDLAILKTFDFRKFKPEVFCIETIDVSNMKKYDETIAFLISKGYQIYADTFINTIFVRTDVVNYKNG